MQNILFTLILSVIYASTLPGVAHAVPPVAVLQPSAETSLMWEDGDGRQSRLIKRLAPSTPESDHSSDCSGGAANMLNKRTVSAP